MAQFIYTMQKVRKAHGDKVILDDVTLAFLPGAKIGVVGPNGAGKSSVLKIMAGLDQASNGDARLADGATVGLLQQEPPLDETKTVRENVEDAVADLRATLARFEEISNAMADPDADFDSLLTEQGNLMEAIDHAEGWELDSRIEQAMDALRCPPGDSPVTHLSGGERRRVALCKLLLEAPDLLLLDEPTNHLDAESVQWLEQHLASYAGAVLAVTHDRYFLDNVAQWILELDRGRAYPYEGNYSTYLEKKSERLAVAGKKDQKLQKRLRDELDWVRQNAKGRQTKSKSRLARYEEMAAEAEKTRKLDFEEIQIPPGPRLGNVVVEASHLDKGFDGELLMKDLSFTLPRGGIVGVIGPNGVGKTTLFKMIVGQERVDAGDLRVGETVKISYVDQNRGGLDPTKNVWELVSDGLDYIKVGQRRDAVARLRRRVRVQGSGPAEAVEGALRWRAQPAEPRADPQGGRQRADARRTHQRPRRRDPRLAGERAAGVPGLRGHHLATTAGSSTASPRTSWRGRATTTIRPSGSGSRATSSPTRRTRSSGSAPRPPARTPSRTASSPGTDPPRWPGSCTRCTCGGPTWTLTATSTTPPTSPTSSRRAWRCSSTGSRASPTAP